MFHGVLPENSKAGPYGAFVERVGGRLRRARGSATSPSFQTHFQAPIDFCFGTLQE